VASDRGNATGALLIHGLGGTQFDLGSLHKMFQRCGVQTHALTLPGHGTRPEDLLPVVAEQWLDAMTRAYRELLPRYDTLHLVGMCMGSLLALEIAKRENHARGRLVVLAAPVFIDGWSTPWYRELRHLLYRFAPFAARMKVEEEDPYGIKNDLVRSIVKARFERGDGFHYRWVPLRCIEQVDRLRGWVMKGLDGIACPTLIVHAREDELTSLRSAYFLRDHLIHAAPELVVLENSYHMVCVDNDRRQVAESVAGHLGLDMAAALRKR
jgi:carboxylesterase